MGRYSLPTGNISATNRLSHDRCVNSAVNDDRSPSARSNKLDTIASRIAFDIGSSWKPFGRGGAVDDAELTNRIRRSVEETFDQDKVILEAQQASVDRIGSSEPGVVIKVDAGPVQGRRVLAAALQQASPR